jgi:hypothetical protein
MDRDMLINTKHFKAFELLLFALLSLPSKGSAIPNKHDTHCMVTMCLICTTKLEDTYTFG